MTDESTRNPPAAQSNSIRASRRQNFAFVGDSTLTFVNYNNVSRLNYRQEARYHNAHRRVRRNRNTPPSSVVISSSPISSRILGPEKSVIRPPTTRLDLVHLSLTEFSLNHRTLVSTRFQLLENVWRNIFSRHFFLPDTGVTSSLIQDPQSTFLSIGRTNWRNYRNMIMQPVVTFEAKQGRQNMDVVWRNQALMLQDFRSLTEEFTGPGLVLTTNQFQEVFNAAFAFIIHCIAFQQDECYNAIIQVNFALMATRENRCLRQAPTVEWIRLLLPRPPPSFHRSRPYQLELLSKIELVLDFLAELQVEIMRSSSQDSMSYDAVLQIVTIDLTAIDPAEPYPNFHLICMHRILFLLHVHLNERSERNCDFLTILNKAAEDCLAYPTSSQITLLLWTFLNQASVRNECRDYREPYFHWAMRDLIAVHKLSFLDQMVAILLHRFGIHSSQSASFASIDTDTIRAEMRAYYSPELPAS